MNQDYLQILFGGGGGGGVGEENQTNKQKAFQIPVRLV